MAKRNNIAAAAVPSAWGNPRWIKIPATRLQLPDVRLSGNRLSQEDRRRILNAKPKPSAFSKVGLVGPK